ncbi:hypothetical protein Tco_1323215 [Tanacetum coccineum]
MEFVFHISNCTVACQIKFATCTLLGNALMWWNSYVKTIGHDASYRMPWKILMKMLTDNYCPRGVIKKLEIKMWNLKVKGMDVVSYTQRFQELTLMCGRMFPGESDQKVRAYAGRQCENKRKFDNNNQAQQQPLKKQSVAIAYTAGSGERKEYVGTLPLCKTGATACTQNGLKNRNHRNQTRGTEAHGMVYALRGGETDQDLDDMEDDINA